MRKLKERITYKELVELFLMDCQIRNLSTKTIDWYRIVLNKFTKMPSRHMVSQHILKSKSSLASVTINGHIRALKAFFNYCIREGQIQDNPIKGIGKLKEKDKTIKHFSWEEIKLLLDTPDKKSFAGLRDYTIMALLLDTGIRISELCGLRIKDINLDAKHLFVTGKGNKERIVPLGNEAIRSIQQYLFHVSDLSPEDFAFVTVNNKPINRNTALQRIKYFGEKANIEGVRVSPHTFRHTFAINYLKNGGNGYYLQSILGHSSSDMTKRYLQYIESDAIEAHQQFSPLDKIKMRRR